MLHPPPPRLFWSSAKGMMLGFVTVNDIAGAADRLLAGTADTLAAQG
ncbi:MAG: hypothetical protein U1E55_00920 [Paracoccus sp. (in: a-proteobacteria)]